MGNRRRRTQRWAFVDESLRANRYLMAAVIADAADLAHLRARLRARRVGGRSRIHFHSETDQRRRQLLDLYATLPITVIAVTARRARGRPNTPPVEPCCPRSSPASKTKPSRS